MLTVIASLLTLPPSLSYLTDVVSVLSRLLTSWRWRMVMRLMRCCTKQGALLAPLPLSLFYIISCFLFTKSSTLLSICLCYTELLCICITSPCDHPCHSMLFMVSKLTSNFAKYHLTKFYLQQCITILAIRKQILPKIWETHSHFHLGVVKLSLITSLIFQ